MPFEDFIGQPFAIAQLRALHADGAHAPVMLIGPSGTGKRVAAAALARAWSSPSEPLVDLTGYALVMDDKAPENEHDRRFAVSRLRRRLSRQAVGPRCVAVTLSGAGREVQNALLKLLEEPPAQTRLIVCADDAQPPLPTVRSRCQAIRFHALDTPALQEIAARDGLHVTGAVLQSAAGSATRMAWLAGRPDIADAIVARDAGTLVAALRDVGEDKDAGLTQTQARRAWCEMVVPALAAGRPAAGDAVAALHSGFRPEACLAVALC